MENVWLDCYYCNIYKMIFSELCYKKDYFWNILIKILNNLILSMVVMWIILYMLVFNCEVVMFIFWYGNNNFFWLIKWFEISILMR